MTMEGMILNGGMTTDEWASALTRSAATCPTMAEAAENARRGMASMAKALGLAAQNLPRTLGADL